MRGGSTLTFTCILNGGTFLQTIITLVAKQLPLRYDNGNDFVSQGPAAGRKRQAHRRFADSTTSIDYSSHMNITRFDDQVAEQIASLPALHQYH